MVTYANDEDTTTAGSSFPQENVRSWWGWAFGSLDDDAVKEEENVVDVHEEAWSPWLDGTTSGGKEDGKSQTLLFSF